MRNLLRITPLALAMCAAGLTGCSKKAQETTPVASEPAAAAAPNPATPAATPAPVAPVAASSPAADPKVVLSEAEAALKAKQYERAALVLLSIQTRNLTEQQSQAAAAQMTRLQKDLAGAVGRGDPQAKAAADLLRRSASGGH